MWFLPSSRKLALPSLMLLAAISIFRLLLGLVTLSQHNNFRDLALRILTDSYHGITLIRTIDHSLALDDQFTIHTTTPLREPHHQVVAQVTQCHYRANPKTQHIRLSHIQILNVSLVPPSQNRYFNPAIIPLPSHATETPYLLISRLVTNGMHQESHVCLADVCIPAESHHRAAVGERTCTDADLELLGARGGMRCASTPEKLNIPPTPARRCAGEWSAFPDIPGFHDPRVFWSGKGEVLIEVNSGSAYGCVGLWIQDLRSVYSSLDDVLKKKMQIAARQENEATGHMNENRESVRGTEWNFLGAPVEYHYLTELTRNPRRGRGEVEKNWVLFFPNEEETWVSYEAMGKVVEDGAALGSQSVIVANAYETVGDGNASVLLGRSDETGLDMSRSGSESQRGEEDGLLEAVDTIGPVNQHLPLADGIPATMSLTSENAQKQTEAAGSHSGLQSMKHHAVQAAPAAEDQSARPFSPFLVSNADFQENHGNQNGDAPKVTVKGGRTIAQLLSHGYSTQNMTSPDELSCFNLTSYTHNHDALGNRGHWHQGSNSLRLIFCTREQVRRQNCAQHGGISIDVMDRTLNADQYENQLIESGLVVHFSIIHRKFNCGWTPCRYERYVLIWEARKPFRMLAVSRYPILFGREKARPWTRQEDVDLDIAEGLSARQDDGEAGEEQVQKVDSEGEPGQLFTYTPSIAWAWRGKGEDESVHRERGHENLGTGYLGDELMVGIGIDDLAQAFVKVKVDEMLHCMRLCPTVGP